MEIEESLTTELDEAQYEVYRANNGDEYNTAMAILDEVQVRYDAMITKRDVAQAAFDTLSVDVPTMKADW